MALTDEQRIAQLETTIAQLSEVIAGLSTAYVSKLQWKQLDTTRTGDFEDRLTAIESSITALTNRVIILEQP